VAWGKSGDGRRGIVASVVLMAHFGIVAGLAVLNLCLFDGRETASRACSFVDSMAPLFSGLTGGGSALERWAWSGAQAGGQPLSGLSSVADPGEVRGPLLRA